MQKYSLVYFTLLAYLISWLLWLPLYLPYFGISSLPVLPFHHALGAIGPFAAAFIVTYWLYGKKGTKELFYRVIKWNVPVKWHILVWLIPFIMLLRAVCLVFIQKESLSNGVIYSPPREFTYMSFGVFVLYNLFSFGFGEETGWRGFALPWLQAKYNS